MEHRSKWLEAAEGIEKDIRYLRMALAEYRKNAENGIPFPSPDHLLCIDSTPQKSRQTQTRRVRRSA